MNEKIILEPMTNDDFDDVFCIMEEAFPDEERRTRERQKLSFQKESCTSLVYRQKGTILGHISYWKTGECYYLEYLSVSSNSRNSGLGAKMMTALLETLDAPLVLEVEPPMGDQIKLRRIGFYERLGFVLNDHFHIQPPLKETTEAVQLLIMSWPRLISEEEYGDFRNILYPVVYDTAP